MACGIASGLSTAGGLGDWYGGLKKPFGNPPPWVFGPVWTVLYAMMGIALGRLIHRRAGLAVLLFGLQFFLNLAWTPVFFGAHQIGLALGIILLMWCGILATLKTAFPRDSVSAWLLVPYLLWVTLASYLNAGIYWLNS